MEQFLLAVALIFAGAVLAGLAWQDWPHLTRRSQQVTGTVVGYRSYTEDGTRSYAAIIRIDDADGQPVTIEDKLLAPLPRPAIGTSISLHYPQGLPHQARIRRPLLRLTIYLTLLALWAVLVGRLLG